MVLEKTHKITLYNDEEHSLAFVQSCLINICNHEPIQAAQCATIVDGVGKYDIQIGNFDEMLEVKFSFDECGLKTEISES